MPNVELRVGMQATSVISIKDNPSVPSVSQVLKMTSIAIRSESVRFKEVFMAFLLRHQSYLPAKAPTRTRENNRILAIMMLTS